jgi:hypothetical protein
MGHLPKYSGCKKCGDSPEPMRVYSMISCDQEDTNDPCESHKGRFYDKLTEDFIVPKEQKTAKMFVCEAKLWAKSLWVGVANGADKIAVYPILEVGNKTITVVNGCRSGEEIFGNPDPGKEFPTGTVIFPVPPAGCDSNFCERVAEAIRTCGAEGVFDLLRESEEICLTNVSELDETERAHLFGGTMPDPCDCPEEYGYGSGSGSLGQNSDNLWRSCLRKLTKIWTNLGGRTVCFGDLPQYNKLNDAQKKARQIVLDQNGCMAKGESVYICDETLDVSEDGADAISVCADGEKRLIKAEANKMLVGCADEDGENPKWVSRPKGLMLYMLDEPIEVHRVSVPEEGLNNNSAQALGSGTGTITVSFADSLLPKKCGKEKIYLLVDSLIGVSGNDNTISIDLFYNNKFYRKMNRNPTASAMRYTFTDIVPADEAQPNQFRFRLNNIQGAVTYRSLIRILGFYA